MSPWHALADYFARDPRGSCPSGWVQVLACAPLEELESLLSPIACRPPQSFEVNDLAELVEDLVKNGDVQRAGKVFDALLNTPQSQWNIPTIQQNVAQALVGMFSLWPARSQSLFLDAAQEGLFGLDRVDPSAFLARELLEKETLPWVLKRYPQWVEKSVIDPAVPERYALLLKNAALHSEEVLGVAMRFVPSGTTGVSYAQHAFVECLGDGDLAAMDRLARAFDRQLILPPDDYHPYYERIPAVASYSEALRDTLVRGVQVPLDEDSERFYGGLPLVRGLVQAGVPVHKIHDGLGNSLAHIVAKSNASQRGMVLLTLACLDIETVLAPNQKGLTALELFKPDEDDLDEMQAYELLASARSHAQALALDHGTTPLPRRARPSRF